MADYKALASGYQYVKNHEYVADCNYLVIIDDTVLGFSKVQNLSMKQEEDIYREGGDSMVARPIQTNNKSTEVLTLEKGVLKSEKSTIINNLVPGCEIEQLSVVVCNEKRDVEKVLYFESGMVTKRSFSNLDAVSGDVLRLTIEISHSGLIEQI